MSGKPIDLNEVREDFLSFKASVGSAQLGTLTADNKPEVSYSPIAWVGEYGYLLVSELSTHTHNLMNNPVMSLLLIEDESSARNLFARKRVMIDGEAHEVPRGTPLFDEVIEQFTEQFGETVQVLVGLPDFHLMQINLLEGRFVRGFGQAFELTGDGLVDVTHIDADRLRSDRSA